MSFAPSGPGPNGDSVPDGPAGANRLGQLVSGRYRIQSLLGEGGMGAVYLAEHTHMRKRVALKLLHPEMSGNAEVVKRFEREAVAASRIDHPNVVAATDFGRTEDGAFFLVLEYVEGTSLRDVLEGGPIAPARAVHIARQVALALDRAHEAGIVHRDLKPENIMLVRRDKDPDFVKVLDFGIAKVVDAGPARPGDAAPLTKLGSLLGTPEYMAPEQALGEAVTAQADLYALGVVLYEMLTGLHPFDVPDRMTMLSFHIVAPVPAMKDRAPQVVVPAPVEDVVRQLLAKDKTARPASARAAYDALGHAADAAGLDVEAAPLSLSHAGRRVSGAPASVSAAAATEVALPTPPARNRPFALPRPVVLAAAGAGALLVLVILVVALRGKKASPRGLTAGSASVVTSAMPRLLSPETIDEAATRGSTALEALAKEYPDDPRIGRRAVVAYRNEGRIPEAVHAAARLVEKSPNEASGDVLAVVTQAAAAAAGEIADEAFALLEGPFGAAGFDALVDIAAGKHGGAAKARATKSLAKPAVREHASPAAAILIDFRAARTCDGKRDLLVRVKEDGDGRILDQLRPLRATRGCGFLSTRDCYPCMRRGRGLDEAIAAVEARQAARSTP